LVSTVGSRWRRGPSGSVLGPSQSESMPHRGARRRQRRSHQKGVRRWSW